MKEDFTDSSFFKRLSAESEEIKKLKWIESEKAGYDIGQNKAVFLWIKYHRKTWWENWKDK